MKNPLLFTMTERLLAAREWPIRKPVMYQRWEDLFFLHWECPVGLLQPLLPSGLTIDTYEGVAHIGIVGFQMRSVRPAGFPPLPWLSAFNELNVRLYVRDASGEPGVYFLSLDCDRSPAVILARSFFSLPYEFAKFTVRPGFQMNCVRNTQKQMACFSWQGMGSPKPSLPGSLEFHLVERYSFFTKHRNRLLRGQVYHSPYEICTAVATQWSDLPLVWDGLPPIARSPDLVHCSRGVKVEVFGLVPTFE